MVASTGREMGKGIAMVMETGMGTGMGKEVGKEVGKGTTGKETVLR